MNLPDRKVGRIIPKMKMAQAKSRHCENAWYISRMVNIVVLVKDAAWHLMRAQ